MPVTEHVLIIATQFSAFPGPRYRDEGAFSGEDFRIRVLTPAFLRAKSKGQPLIVVLDGTYGYSTGFLEESFGGLVRALGKDQVSGWLKIASNEEPHLIEEVFSYILNAEGD